MDQISPQLLRHSFH